MQTGIPQIFTIYAPPKQHLWDKTGCEAEFFSKLCSLELDTTQCFYFAHAGMWHSVKLNFWKGNAMPLWKPALSLHMASIAVSHKAQLLLTASGHCIPAKFGTWGLTQRYLQIVVQAQHRALPAHGQLGHALSRRLSDPSFVGHYFSILENESFRRMEPEEGN